MKKGVSVSRRNEGSQSYQVSASWLDRLEREQHELTVNKLIALAGIYNVTTEQLLRSMYPEDVPPTFLKELSCPNATLLITEGPLEKQAQYLLPDSLSMEQPPEDTALLPVENNYPVAPFRRGIIGKRDLTLDPYDSGLVPLSRSIPRSARSHREGIGPMNSSGQSIS